MKPEEVEPLPLNTKHLIMKNQELTSITLIGISLKSKTTNEHRQSNTDCGNLWQKFEKESVFNKIENKLSDEIFAVYHNYEGDHTKPFSYFIGCKVAEGTEVPEDLDSLTTAKGTFHKTVAKGKMPDCVANAWREIWKKDDSSRAYKADFEVYDERSHDWQNAEVDIFIGKTKRK